MYIFIYWFIHIYFSLSIDHFINSIDFDLLIISCNIPCIIFKCLGWQGKRKRTKIFTIKEITAAKYINQFGIKLSLETCIKLFGNI